MKSKWVVAMLAGVLIGLLPALGALAAPLSDPANPGDGLMVVQPTHIVYGNQATFVFTFTANNDFPSGSQVALFIPTGWPAPTTAAGVGHVSVSAGSCTFNASPGWQINSRRILVNLDNCLTDSSFTINYTGLAPAVAGSPYTFTTRTDLDGSPVNLVDIIAGSPTIAIDTRPVLVRGGLVPASKVYDGTTAATLTIGTPRLFGLITGDVVGLDTSAATGAFEDKNAGSTKKVEISNLALTGADAGNYRLKPQFRSASISPSPITLTAVTDSKVYDGTTSSNGVPSRTSGAIQTGDTEPAWTQTFNNKNAGTGKIITPVGTVDDGNGGNNYVYTRVTATGSISQRAISITTVPYSKVYDGTTQAGIPSFPSVVPDTANFIQSFDTKHIGTGKTITASGNVNDGNAGLNYAYTFGADSIGDITVRPITVTAVTDTKFYDGTTASSLQPDISPGLYGTDTSGFSQAFDSPDVFSGLKITPSGNVNDGNGGANYSVTLHTVSTGVINPKPITVTANWQTKTQGAPDPLLTYTVNPALLGSDTFTGSLNRAPGETYGSYPITQGTLSASTNYAITFVGADLVIGPAISGNAGIAGATLSYTDGTLKSVTADSSGDYVLIVSLGWTGTVTPSKSGYGFTPASITYSTPVTSDLTGQNYSTHPLITVSFRSTAALDGWVLETSRTSSLGGTINSTASLFNLGDDASKRQYRSILSFSTSLPSTAVITSVNLKFKRAGKVHTDPFTIVGNNILADVRKGPFSGTNALQSRDFQAGASANAVLTYTSTLVNGWYSQNLDMSKFIYINRTGVTQFRLRFTNGDNNNNIADYLTLYSGNAAAANRPILTIKYYVP